MLFSRKMLATGCVQGVGFRAFACKVGESLHLVGYSKNLHNGSVEIVAEGEKEALDSFAKRISVKQPFGMNIEKLEILEEKEIGARSYASFSVAH
ncbi:MAG: acylphosphatase [Candidatus Micrarchaeia archaeon]